MKRFCTQYYFSHDYDPLTDKKMEHFIEKFKAEGYGIFWRIIEKLHANQSHHLKLDDRLYQQIALDLYVDKELVCEIIDKCIIVYGFFIMKNGYIHSERVLWNIEQRESKTKKYNKSNSNVSSNTKCTSKGKNSKKIL